MHSSLYSTVLILLLVLPACNTMQEREGDLQTDGRPERTYITAQANNPDRENYAWQGNLDGQYPVLMWYKEFDNEIVGKLFYTEQENAKPIKLIGRKNGQEYRLQEMNADGRVSGTWYLIPDAISIEGYWKSPDGGRIYNASLMHIDTAVAVHLSR